VDKEFVSLSAAYMADVINADFSLGYVVNRLGSTTLTGTNTRANSLTINNFNLSSGKVGKTFKVSFSCLDDFEVFAGRIGYRKKTWRPE
jgi:hypothetical protein